VSWPVAGREEDEDEEEEEELTSRSGGLAEIEEKVTEIEEA
jgi:hypothetical protein